MQSRPVLYEAMTFTLYILAVSGKAKKVETGLLLKQLMNSERHWSVCAFGTLLILRRTMQRISHRPTPKFESVMCLV